MAKILEDMMKPVAHEHEFCSSVQFDLCYKTLVFQQTEEGTNMGGEADNLGSEGE